MPLPPSPHQFTATIVVAPGDGVAPAVLLTVGGEERGTQYLFAAPEGYARLALEHRVRPGPRLRAIFAASTHPRSLGGLGGLLMRLRSDGHGEVRLVGRRGTAGAAAALRHLVSWRHPRLFVDEVDSAPGACAAFEDDVVEVVALCGDGGGWAPPAWLGGGRGAAAAAAAPTPTTPQPDYELTPPGSSNPVYARPGGAGDQGTAPSSSTIWAWLVHVRAGPPGQALLIADVSDEAALALAAAHPATAALASFPCLAASIHLTPARLAASPAYTAWAGRFTSSPAILAAVHPPSAPAAAWVGHRSVATTLAKLAAVDGELFPGGGGVGGGGDATAAASLLSTFTPGRLMLRLRSGGAGRAATIDASACLPAFDGAAVRAEAVAELERLGLSLPPEPSPPLKKPRPPPPKTNQAAAAALRARLAGREVAAAEAYASPPPPPPPPTLTFLGTGSAEPSAHRGASALFLTTSATSSGLLLDAGEGTAGALARAHGHAALSTLSAVWVSHRHADHCLGVAGVAVGKWESTGTPLPIIGPHAVRRWLADLEACGALPTGSTTFTHASARPPPSLLTALSLSSWRDAPAVHCADAHALILDGAAGWRLAVSGDSVPCPAFAAAAAGADLLVHEATFGAGKEADAEAKKHATIAGALGLAKAARATRTVLTHFSQRYPGMPPDAEADAEAWEAAGAAAAVDGMVVALSGGGWERLPGVGRAAVAALAGLRSSGGGEEEEEEEEEEAC